MYEFSLCMITRQPQENKSEYIESAIESALVVQPENTCVLQERIVRATHLIPKSCCFPLNKSSTSIKSPFTSRRKCSIQSVEKGA